MNSAMNDVRTKIEGLNWANITSGMQQKGYVLIQGLLSEKICAELIGLYISPGRFRKTVVMERYRFGLGEYKYFDYPLPPVVQALREQLYSRLAPIANRWISDLKMDAFFPDELRGLHQECLEHGQQKPTPLLLKYGAGGFNTLHQDLYGEVYFPLQTVFFLNEPDVDYLGGEFVLTQNSPRAQAKAIVLRPKKGDMLIFPTNFRPIQGSRGYYRARMKHGVSEVHSGERHTLGIIFHDALS